jgi:FkbM family methyltransferase
MSQQPLVSIIIASYNTYPFIKNAIESVLKQTYRNIELIVIDGGSSDQTIKILESFDRTFQMTNGKSQRSYFWISEKDKGIADAFNKGVTMAHGDYLYFLGADDVLKTSTVIEEMMKGVDIKKDMILCGRIDRISRRKKYSVVYTTNIFFHPLLFLYKMALPHQGIFMHKDVFKTCGRFNLHYTYAMDYDLLLRAYQRYSHICLKDVTVAGWREGGIGKDRLYEILDEYHRIRTNNHIAPLWILNIVHFLVLIRYIVPEKLHKLSRYLCGIPTDIKRWVIRCEKVLDYIRRNNAFQMVPFRIIWSASMLLYMWLTKTTITIHLWNGKQLMLFPGNALTSFFLYTDIPDRKEIFFLRNHCQNDTIFIDIGANIGSYAICLADAAQSVIAIEPFPLVAKRCKQNFHLNHIPIKNVHEIALGAHNTTARFTKNLGETQNHMTYTIDNTFACKSQTLDTFMQKHSLSKEYSYVMNIDVEGGECDLVRGASHFLKSRRVYAIVYESFGNNAFWMKTTLKKFGFTVRLLSDHNYCAVRN